MKYALCVKLWPHNLMKNVKYSKINIFENSFNKDKSVGL